MPSPRLINANPNTYNPNAPTSKGVRPGDVVVDMSGAQPGASMITGAPGAFTLTPVGGGLPLQVSGISLNVTNPGGAGTARVTCTVIDPGPNTGIVGAIVQLFVRVTGPAALTAGVAGTVGTVESSLLDGNAATSLLILGITGLAGKLEVDVSGTAGAAFAVAGIVVDPLPSSAGSAGGFSP